jgi:hypothetical protein
MSYQFGLFQAGDDGINYKGIYQPSKYWNGWRCPLFDYETAKSIIESQMSLEDCDYYSCSYYELSQYPKGIIDRHEDDVMFFPVINFEGVEYYSIGFMNWTWFKVDDRLTEEA